MIQKLYSNIKLKANPTDNEHIVNKKYVDDLINGKIKEPVRVVLGTNFEGTYEGTGMTLTQTTASEVIIDGVAVELNDRILLIGQTDSTQNGIYEITTLGVTSGEQAVLTRAEDFNSSSDIKSNVRIPVSQGDANKDTSYILITDGVITLDTTSLEFTRFSAEKGISKAVGSFIGDGAATTFTITHGLGTKEIAEPTIYDKDGVLCKFDYETTTDNMITIKSDVVLEALDGTFNVIILA